MKNYLDKRSFPRYAYEVPVKVFTGARKEALLRDGNYPSMLGRVSNYSRGGMYLECEFSILPGTPVVINLLYPINNSLTGTHKKYHAKVRWCKKITGSGMPVYGIGTIYERFGNDSVFGFGRVKFAAHTINNRTVHVNLSQF